MFEGAVDNIPPRGAEVRQPPTEWNETRSSYPQLCVPDLIRDQASHTPEKVAAEFGSKQLSYAELEARSNQLARYLLSLGMEPEALIGICLERSLDMLIGLLGILKAGCAYVPIDPSYPAERQAFMLSNSLAPMLITQARLLDRLPTEGRHVVCLDRDGSRIEQLPSEPPQAQLHAEQLAYVIYTSGSTGQPKGVEIPHRALVNLLWAMRVRPGLQESDVMVAVTTLSFDIAGLELLLPLLAGGCVVIAPAETTSQPRALARLLQSSAATVMQATPSTWRMLLDSGWRGRPGMKALCGGEALPVALAGRLVGAGLELWNMYGPTETTIWSTCVRVPPDAERLTIGRPIANTYLYILDAERQPVAVGDAGELWIGGAGVARGYRGRPDLTAERFLSDPFAGSGEGRMYRTGDLARFRPDGEVEFLGRADHQVKVRGFRIELGEVEAVLARHHGVREAVVMPRQDGGESAQLAAYVVPFDGMVTARQLRQFAAESLPAYMVPSSVTMLQALPLAPNGKVDRNALPEPGPSGGRDHELVPAGTSLEQRLVGIWERELGIEPIGVTDDFFDLGVTSIRGASLFAAIERELGSELPLGAIFQAPTVRGLAELLEHGNRRTRWSTLVAIQPRGTRPPIFCVHGGAGTILHLAPLARRLGEDQPFYGLQSRGLYGGVSALTTVEDMATHYLAEMREVWPRGPWYLAGYCFGAIVAFEMAQRLKAEAEDVELLAMFNGPSPEWIRQWGWHGNQPTWRARHPGPPGPTAQELRQRKRRAIIRDPRRLWGELGWVLRRPRTAAALRLGRPVPEGLREHYFLELHGKAERAYSPVPYEGEILMFYGDGLYEDPALGWGPLACTGARAIAVPGEHDNNRRAMMEPGAAFIAERLQEYLDPERPGR